MADFHRKQKGQVNRTLNGNAVSRGNSSGMKNFMPLLTYVFLIFCVGVFVWYTIFGANEPTPITPEADQQPFVTDELSQIQIPETPSIASPDDVVTDDPGASKPDLPPPVKVKGLYVMAWNAGVPEYMSNYIELCETTELNALVIDVKDDEGNITFNTVNEDLSAACMNIVPNFGGLVSDLKDRGIYTIARIVCFRDELWSTLHPELAIAHKDGGSWKDGSGRTWLDPYDPGAWEYISDIALEAVSLGFDEIQLDYVRFPTDGRIGDINYGTAAEEKTKTEIISESLTSLRAELSEHGVSLSADVFGIIALSRSDSEAIGQDTTLLLNSADSICPMIYPSHFANKRQNGVGQYINGILFEAPDLDPYGVVFNTLHEFKRYLGDSGNNENTGNNSVINSDNTSDTGVVNEVIQAVIRPYLQHFTASYLGDGYYQQYTAEKVREQINAVYDAGFDEWILWNHKSVYSADALLPVESDILGTNTDP